MITELEFQSLAAQGHNRIPLIAEAFADLETPLSLYLKLAGGQPHSFLLESVVGGERFGRYSFIGLPARTLLRATGFVSEVVTDGRVVERDEGNPLDFIAAYQRRFKPALRPGLPRFCGGLAGYFGYDAVRFIEPRLAKTQKTGGLDTPDILLLQTEELAVIDNLSGRLYLIVWADPGQPEAYFRGKRRLAELTDKLRYSVTAPAVKRGASYAVERETSREQLEAAVRRAKEYIAAGDCMQVVIGQRLRKRYTESPLSLYRALRSLNPSPYMYFYDLGDFQIVGASPEILVRQEQSPEGPKVTIRPLAGTRPRGTTPERDAELSAELQADPKERAEHLMLIDLARNDIGRIAKTGSVKVTEAFAVERYSHVMHIVSNVEGLLAEGLTNLDVLKATFPAGTLSGAPKIRAMEIIDELEPVKRGIYGGACGYLSFAGDMDLAIAIRTGIVQKQTLYVQAAAGVVADSVPELEWKETEQKARALIRAAELVEEGVLIMLLMIDNYDSFTFNLVQYFGELGAEVTVVRNDQIDLPGIEARKPDHLVLSPGPCSPAEAGICIDAIRHFQGRLPILGVCLGHQAIGAALGGRVIRAKVQMHGKTDTITADGRGVYEGLPSHFSVVRYHSLAIERETLPEALEVTSSTADGEIMGVRHRALAGGPAPLEGVQFHPESILSEHGHAMLRNFLRMGRAAH